MSNQPHQPTTPLTPPAGRTRWLWEEDPPKDLYQLYTQIAIETLGVEVSDYMFGLSDAMKQDMYHWLEMAVSAALAAADVEPNWEPLLEQALTETRERFPL